MNLRQLPPIQLSTEMVVATEMAGATSAEASTVWLPAKRRRLAVMMAAEASAVRPPSKRRRPAVMAAEASEVQLPPKGRRLAVMTALGPQGQALVDLRWPPPTQNPKEASAVAAVALQQEVA